jgi:hypothetical protein
MRSGIAQAQCLFTRQLHPEIDAVGAPAAGYAHFPADANLREIVHSTVPKQRQTAPSYSSPLTSAKFEIRTLQ